MRQFGPQQTLTLGAKSFIRLIFGHCNNCITVEHTGSNGPPGIRTGVQVPPQGVQRTDPIPASPIYCFSNEYIGGLHCYPNEMNYVILRTEFFFMRHCVHSKGLAHIGGSYCMFPKGNVLSAYEGLNCHESNQINLF